MVSLLRTGSAVRNRTYQSWGKARCESRAFSVLSAVSSQQSAVSNQLLGFANSTHKCQFKKDRIVYPRTLTTQWYSYVPLTINSC